MPVVDNHAHLDHARVGEARWDVAEALTAAREVNVTRVVQIGCDLEAARWTVDMVDRFPAMLGGVGLHPTEASKAVGEHVVGGHRRSGKPVDILASAMAQIEELAGHPRVCVIGETGLDHYWVPEHDRLGRAAQEDCFRMHIDLAKRLGKVLQIHDREAHDDVLRVLQSEGAPERTVFHCYSGDAAMARYCVERGWYLSFAGPVTFKNAHALREAVAATPLAHMQVETDAPYLAPHPFRGQANASYLVPLVVRRIADVKGLPVEEVCSALNECSRALYGPWRTTEDQENM